MDITNEHLRKAFSERLAGELSRMGLYIGSPTQIAREFNVVRQTLDNWATEHKEFFNALTQARELALAAWEDKADTGIEMQGFHHGLWGRIMAARFPDDYRENSRHELTGAGGKDLIPQSGVLVVPAAIDAESWEKAVAAQQASLTAPK